MYTITYTISGTYPPFGVELRENNSDGAIIAEDAHLTEGTYEFNDIDLGKYVLVVYDATSGVEIYDIPEITTTTTTTTTTTIPPTTGA